MCQLHALHNGQQAVHLLGNQLGSGFLRQPNGELGDKRGTDSIHDLLTYLQLVEWKAESKVEWEKWRNCA